MQLKWVEIMPEVAILTLIHTRFKNKFKKYPEFDCAKMKNYLVKRHAGA